MLAVTSIYVLVAMTAFLDLHLGLPRRPSAFKSQFDMAYLPELLPEICFQNC